MSFPASPTVGLEYTNEAGITYTFNEKGAWQVLSNNEGSVNYTISATAPVNPSLGDQWWDTTTTILKSWASSGDEYFWTAIGGTNELAPIVSDTEPVNPEIGTRWYYLGNEYVFLEILGIKQWVPVSASTEVQKAQPIAWYFAEEAFNMELFGSNYDYSWRDFGNIAITAADNGDDSIEVADTSNITPDTNYVIVSGSGDALATVNVLSVVNATKFRIKNAMNFSLTTADKATISKTSFDISTPGRAVVTNGDVLFSKPLTALRLRNGLVYIRRTAAGPGVFTVQYRITGTTTWINAPFLTSDPVIGNTAVRDESYQVTAVGTIEFQVSYAADSGQSETITFLVLATSKENIENSRVDQPTNVTPADQAINVSATPTLQLSTYRSLYQIAQGGAEFKVGQDRGMTNVVYSTSTDFLAGWIAVAGQTAAFNSGVFYNGKTGVLVGDGGVIKLTTDGGKTLTAGASSITTDLYDVSWNHAGRIFVAGLSAKVAYSDNGGVAFTNSPIPDAFAGDFWGVTAQTNVVLAVGTSGKIIRSTNNGAIFASVTQANAFAGTFTAIDMMTTGTAVAVGTTGEIQTSNNFGVDWTHRAAPGGYTGTYRAVRITDNGVVIAVGDNGAIHKSTDYGATWVAKTPATVGFTGAFRGVDISSNYAIVVGNNGEVESSSDLGDTWTKRSLAAGSTTQANFVAASYPSEAAIAAGQTAFGLVAGESGLLQTSIRLDGSVTSVAIPAGSDLLQVNQVYWWTGRYQDAVGYWSSWSAPTAFATQANFSYVQQPANLAPANAATNTAPLPTLQGSAFIAVGDADSHATSQWQISTDPAFGTISYDSGVSSDKTATTVPASAILSNTVTYYWRVHYVGVSGRISPWSSPTSFTVVSQPNAPSITYPTANAVSVSRTPTIQTSAYSIPGGTPAQTSAQYQIATDVNFASIVFDSGAVGAPNLLSYTVPSTNQLNLNTNYYVRARHRGDGTSWSGWSPSRLFTTIAAGSLPSIASFTNSGSLVNTIGYVTSSNSFTFTIDPTAFASAGGDSLISSSAQIASDSGFTNIIATVNLANKDAATAVTISGSSYPTLINYRTAYVRVQHVGSLSGPTGYGAAISVAVQGPTGEQSYTSPGTYNWTCPTGVTSICAVAVGAGANTTSYGGAGGGGLVYKNNIATTPGQTYQVVVGNGAGGTTSSSFASMITGYGGSSSGSSQGVGGSYAGGDGGGVGGYGGTGGTTTSSYTNTTSPSGVSGPQTVTTTTWYAGGGGGAGGYNGNGGNGGGLSSTAASAGANGGGGGGGRGYQTASSISGGGGGGTHVYGLGANGGAGAAGGSNSVNGYGGGGGSSGNAGAGGSTGGNGVSESAGGAFGGGAGGNGRSGANSPGGNGAVRLIWGTGRSFPTAAG